MVEATKFPFKLAVLDLGTNTFHCLIVSVEKSGEVKNIFKTKTVVKLGEGAIHENRIDAIPFQRGIDAISNYHSFLKEHQVEHITAFATSAIRGAANGIDFVNRVREETGINIQVIPGDREAELIYRGVSQCVALTDEPVLIMDIGGGSTEFIIGNKQEIFWKYSFDIGAARLLEMFKPSDPITDKEVEELQGFFSLKLQPLQEALMKFSVDTLIGSSGSFDTFAEMIGHRFYNRNIISNRISYQFDINDFKSLYKVLLPSTIRERMEMKGLVKMRVDMIVVAAICTDFILRSHGMKKMMLSKYALKEGALWEELNKFKLSNSLK